MDGGVDFGAAVQGIVARLESKNPDIPISARIQRAWRSVCGDAMRAHTDAVFVVPDTMGEEVIIYVDSPIWATDLNLQSELLRLRLNLKLQEYFEQEGISRTRHDGDDLLFEYERNEHVKKLRFVPSKEKYTKKFAMERDGEDINTNTLNVVPQALDEDEVCALREAVASIEDPDLREAAFEAARAHLELKKGAEAHDSQG